MHLQQMGKKYKPFGEHSVGASFSQDSYFLAVHFRVFPNDSVDTTIAHLLLESQRDFRKAARIMPFP